jgi:hypothetical protein
MRCDFNEIAGEFRDDVLNGFGKYYYADGETYEGMPHWGTRLTAPILTTHQ